MSENYPFTGTGNLFRFCQGLAQIKIQNRVVVLFDNDAAGREAEQRVTKLSLPRNMKVVRLPDLEECMKFPTVGPNGEATEDINGRAVSIELFLDLSGAGAEPRVRWTSFNQGVSDYQGDLIQKDGFTRRFLKTKFPDPSYNATKLERLLDHICAQIVRADFPVRV